MDLDGGIAAARRCGIMLLAQMKAALGSLDRVERIVKLGVFVNSAPAFTDQPKVANGASELMQEVFGEAGPPRAQRGRSRRPAARRRGRGRRDRRGEGLVHLARLTHVAGMADRETEVRRQASRPAFRGARRRRLGPARRRRSVPQPRLPFGARGFGQRRSRHRLDARADPDRGRGARLVAAAPAYLKSHSQGEYVFDHGWAEAWERAGGAILSQAAGRGAVHAGAGPAAARRSAAATARRGRGGDGPERPVVGAHHLHRRSRRGGMRAARLADPPRHPISLVQSRLCELRRFPRPRCRSRKRKAIRKERAAAREGLEIPRAARRRDRPRRMGRDVGLLPGHRRRANGAGPISRATSSTWSASGWATGCCCSSPAATAGRSPARSTSSAPTRFTAAIGAAIEEVPFLHFELCYYQAIEWAIDHGLASVQAGAQGEHKLARGYEPVITRSAHFIPNPSFRDAVADFLEARARRRSQPKSNGCGGDLPYRSSSSA